MKKYTRPELKAELIIDINEPVYMGCSGKQYFPNPQVAQDYEHQSTQTGRNDCRFQADATFYGPVGQYNGPVYCFLKFHKGNIVVDSVNDWSKVSSWDANGVTYWVGVQDYTLNGHGPDEPGNDVGFGDLICYDGDDPTADVLTPDIAFALNWTSGDYCV